MRTVRKDFGSKGDQIFKNEGDDTDVCVYIEWDTMENANKFRESKEIREAMQKGGVVDIAFYLTD
jgi:heme-degrading monooxygenase HmoA